MPARLPVLTSSLKTCQALAAPDIPATDDIEVLIGALEIALLESTQGHADCSQSLRRLVETYERLRLQNAEDEAATERVTD